jgi:predicted RNase H-like HicB family nuclease
MTTQKTLGQKHFTIYRAEIPDIYGYGVVGYGLTVKEALQMCKEAFKRLSKAYRAEGDHPKFEDKFEDFGGVVEVCTPKTNFFGGNLDYVDTTTKPREWVKKILKESA